jgi:Na+-driven multidrug efflux pump
VIVPTWFLYLGGFSMLALGLLQIVARLQERDEEGLERYLNLGTAWSALCITVGVGLLAMATGWWTPEALRPAPRRPASSTKRWATTQAPARPAQPATDLGGAQIVNEPQ